MTDSNIPRKAFILAAGLGTRLRPYTDTMPKPMVPIAGKSIIRRALEKLARERVVETVVNLHHLADILKDHLETISCPRIVFSKEETILETGGGIKKALSVFGEQAFYIINGDALWDDPADGDSALKRLGKTWNPDVMDILILVQPVDRMPDGQASGDYDVAENGRATRSKDKSGKFMFAGIRIADPKIFGPSPEGAFSFLSLMDEAQAKGRLYALIHNGDWYHISTPDDYRAVDSIFTVREGT